jgi:hypothetical protein
MTRRGSKMSFSCDEYCIGEWEATRTMIGRTVDAESSLVAYHLPVVD